jgi:phospholipid-binding lipoprotein MlaA
MLSDGGGMIDITRQAFWALFCFCLVCSLVGCAGTNKQGQPSVLPAMHSVSEIDDEYIAGESDPWEGFNRNMYKVNYHFDKYILLPVVSSYEFVTPSFVQAGVSNFFSNIGEIETCYNSLLQAKGGKVLTTMGRFLINSTIGVAGLFDPATCMGLVQEEEDFGQTLGAWGVDDGPYLILPLFGPGTARSAAGLAIDSAIQSTIADAMNVDDDTQLTGTAIKAADTRHRQPFRYYESGYPFEYSVVRFLYREKQKLAAMK